MQSVYEVTYVLFSKKTNKRVGAGDVQVFADDDDEASKILQDEYKGRYVVGITDVRYLGEMENEEARPITDS